jgi:hypothetical protein
LLNNRDDSFNDFFLVHRDFFLNLNLNLLGLNFS